MPRELHVQNQCHDNGQNSRYQESFTSRINDTIMVLTRGQKSKLKQIHGYSDEPQQFEPAVCHELAGRWLTDSGAGTSEIAAAAGNTRGTHVADDGQTQLRKLPGVQHRPYSSVKK